MTSALPFSMPCLDQRSDRLKNSILARKVARAIAATGYAWLNQINICANAGVVRLTGNVHSLFLRDVAQQVAQNVPGVHSVECQLRVE